MMSNSTLDPIMHNAEVEQSVLGALLLDNLAWDRLEGTLTANDFYLPEHQRIFAAMGAMFESNHPVDVVTLGDTLAGQDGEARSQTLQYLNEIAHNTPSAANITRYAQILTELRTRRKLFSVGQQIITLAHEAKNDGLLDEASRLVMQLSDDNSDVAAVQSLRELLPTLIDTIDDRAHGRGGFNNVRTGFTQLDQLTSGLQNGDLIIVAGRPSMGKTTLAINIAENIALNDGTALVVSLEMSKAQLAERNLARFAQINTQTLRSGKLSQTEFSRLGQAVQTLEDRQLVIADDVCLSNVARIRMAARKLRQSNQRLDVIVIDYLQLMQGKGNTRNEELSGITRALKLLAKELNCPVVLLSQLSREVEKRADKRPLLSDLRESGAIEQDADVVIMLYRDDYYHDESTKKGFAQLLIRKQRMGPVGQLYLRFEGQYSRFLDANPEQINALHQSTTTDVRPYRTFG